MPTFNGDIHLAKKLVHWIRQLDNAVSHGLLLIADPAVSWTDANDLLLIASSVFQRVEIITPEETTEGWVVGANTLFKTAAKFFQDRRIGPWLWLEPDAVPLKKGWLDTIQVAYFAAGKPFFGSVMQATEPNMPKDYLAGVAVYPQDALRRTALVWDESKAFDVATASVTVPNAADSKLLQHFWGQKDLPPTFVAEKTAESPRNAFTLDNINPEAVVFHRVKDMSLMRLLGYREPRFTEIVIDVVFPAFSGDARLMVKNLKWLGFLHGKKQATAVLLVDVLIADGVRGELIGAAKAAFSDVVVHVYSSRASGWPHGPNCAFQEACYVMGNRSEGRGWLWYEADMVAVVPDWLEQLSQEYAQAKKPFMGTIIECMGWHLQGTAIYPPNVHHYCKSLPRIKEAFDVALNPEITPHRHRANHLMKHDMSPPSFASAPDLRAIDPGIVLYHPDKSGQLLDRLAESMLK